MAKYEYQAFSTTGEFFMNIETYLNEIGADGWEVVAINSREGTDRDMKEVTVHDILCKRKIE